MLDRAFAVWLAVGVAVLAALAALVVIAVLILPPAQRQDRLVTAPTATPAPTFTPLPTPTPFDPSVGAPLPGHRLVLSYGIPGADVTGPVGEFPPGPALDQQVAQQAAAFTAADPVLPVMPGLDLVADIADGFPGPANLWSHRLDSATIQAYIAFCQHDHLLLFFDLQFGWSSVQNEVTAILPYLEQYPFTELAIDPEFAFPPGGGIPDVNVGHLDASQINWAIQTLAAIPAQFHVPRKVVMIHEFRPEMLTHKSQIIQTDPRVSVVLHTDGFGPTADKLADYQQFVANEWNTYGGFKIFYRRDEQPVMTPAQIVALRPTPAMVTYGN